jgi:hypothetical protein
MAALEVVEVVLERCALLTLGVQLGGKLLASRLQQSNRMLFVVCAAASASERSCRLRLLLLLLLLLLLQLEQCHAAGMS